MSKTNQCTHLLLTPHY